MASPPSITTKTLTGKFTINKSLSDNPDALFTLQGLSWFTRRTIWLATIILTVKEYEESGMIHIDITSAATGLSSTQEDRTLDWENRPHQDKVFGNVSGRSRMIDLSGGTFEPQEPYDDAAKEFLQAKKLKDGKTQSRFEDESALVQSYAKNQDKGYGWTAEQVWGFEEVQGKRYYTRRIVARNANGNKIEKVRLVYDYQGPLN